LQSKHNAENEVYPFKPNIKSNYVTSKRSVDDLLNWKKQKEEKIISKKLNKEKELEDENKKIGKPVIQMNKNSKYLLQNKWQKKPENAGNVSVNDESLYLKNKYGDDEIINKKLNYNNSSNSINNLIKQEENDEDRFSQLWPIELNKNFI